MVAEPSVSDITDRHSPGSRPRLAVNGRERPWSGAPGAMLLHVLRDEFGLTGSKAACERGECGACTVLVGGVPLLSCMQLATLIDAPVTTIEGLAEEATPLREAFADLGAFQCGFCTPGQIVHGWAIVRGGLPADRAAAEQSVRHRMSGNLCRCTGYAAIVEAIVRTAHRTVPPAAASS